MAWKYLQWNHSCDSLIRLVNSNTSMTKVLVGDYAVSIGKLESVTNPVCKKSRPGTVVMIDETDWHVAVADGVVKLGEFWDEMGRSITAQKLAVQCHIIEGKQLPIVTPKQTEWLTIAHGENISSQPYWSKSLGKFELPQLFCVQKNPTQPPAWAITYYQKTLNDITAIDVVVAWLIYIARDIQTSQLQIDWNSTEYFCCENEAPLPICANVFSKNVAFGTFINLNDTFSV